MVLINVTVNGIRGGTMESGPRELTMAGNVHPDGIVVESVLVGVEALERVLIARVVAIHGGIVLMSEDKARTGDALSGGLGALPTQRLLLIALELPLTASETVGAVSKGGLQRQRGKGTGSPSCS